MSDINFHVHFHFKKNFTLKNRKKLKHFIIAQLKQFGKSSAQINIIFCSDKALLCINQAYLQHDYYTDIITFDLSESKSNFLTSDIYISVDRVRGNAKNLQAPFPQEMQRVIFHGVLHLLGYKDKTSNQRQEMREMEDKWIKEYTDTLHG